MSKLYYFTIYLKENEGNIIYLDDPLNIVGDIHGYLLIYN